MRIFKYPIKLYLQHPSVHYYLRHPEQLLFNRFELYRLKLNKYLNKDINFKYDIFSKTKIDIVIPAIDKDLEVLPYVIDSLRLHIKHPIGKIIIVSPNSLGIKKLCKKKKCQYLFEDTVLPIKKKDINYIVDGSDRSGWVYQQLLKWSCDTYSNSEHILIAESDTIINRPQIFITNGKIILACSDSICHIPYWQIYRKLLGNNVKAIYNFTSHHLLFEKKKLKQFKKDIEKNCKIPWYEAVIKNLNPNESSSISDYEEYGQYVWNNYKDDYTLEHWFNLSLKRSELGRISELSSRYKDNYKTISFHSYNA